MKDKREEADKVLLRDDITSDQKLYLIHQLYKDELQNQFPQLNYALLGWKDSHRKELFSKEVMNCLEDMGL